MIRVLFLIHDLGQGGAEKVLINLVNNMDYSKFDITVMTLFDYGENRQFLDSHVHYRTWCRKKVPANSRLMKLLTPKQLYRLIIREKYDIEIAYLEGPCARVISGCNDASVKKISWIHIEQHTSKIAAGSFRSVKEARKCYQEFDKIICVSEEVKRDFEQALYIPVKHKVLYNTNESERIMQLANEIVDFKMVGKDKGITTLIGVGKLLKNKGFDRLVRIVKRLKDERYNLHLYILGEGPEYNNLQNYIKKNKLDSYVTLLGYQLNPYKYMAKSDLFVCASLQEGFSTAATEALILGIPVCTVLVSGMREMLGDNEFGVIVENNDQALYLGIKRFLDEPKLLNYYQKQARKRGEVFKSDRTVSAVEDFLFKLYKGDSDD